MAALSYHNKRILIVDDQRPFLIMLRGVMNNLGATNVVIANNGETAVSSCRKEKFDIVIADLHLGSDKKNGFQLLEELRERKLISPSTLFIMVSADSERPVVLGSMEKRPDDFIIKPFSQAQINSRLSKAYQKRQTLLPIYKQISEKNYQAAADLCREFIQHNQKYKQYCLMLLVELLWLLNQNEQALSILKSLEKSQATPLPWVSVALARTYMNQGKLNDAIYAASGILNKRLFAADGLDILAQCYSNREDFEQAIEHIRKAIDTSPLSLKRQFLGCEIARAAGDWTLAKECCQAILSQTKRSVHRSVIHLCNYVRSILDEAEHADDKNQRNKLQQEAMVAIERNRRDELLTRTREAFDFEIFEELIGARINVLDGRLLDAKLTLTRTQKDIDTRFDDYPIHLAPESMTLAYSLGEYEHGNWLMAQIKDSELTEDPSTQFLVTRTERQQAQAQASYNKFSKEGRAFYAGGQYQAAYESFTKALELAPMNTGVTINLLQCMMKLFEMMEKPEPQMITRCRQLFRTLESVPLTEQYKLKFDSIKGPLQDYIRRRR
ncbi:hypothetical protein HMF8227_01583 [Saliniradius amylolyticus]|uniref:Response regulatory domain-containing protein n=1 Tax=Saliniradius amylolyticus TaxID=2183582 RepID=A0A2S2E4Z2_9ALTE|nr:response regulator [Saliniradius amylolyticus]AWL12057.1 hypothetical protein HMF8227_01583 [Saliniradius amylolyticus]